jgi:hypothetical protein
LRHPEVEEILDYVASGGSVYPLSLLQVEK